MYSGRGAALGGQPASSRYGQARRGAAEKRQAGTGALSTGLRSWIRGDDPIEDRSTQPAGEARSLPAPGNELPLASAYTTYGAFGEKAITPQKALQIADVWSAVRVLADATSSLPLHVHRDPVLLPAGASGSGRAACPEFSGGPARPLPKPT